MKLKVKKARLRRLFVMAVLMGAVLVLGACGSDGGDESSTASVSKAVFIKQADAVCSKTENNQEKLLQVYGQKIEGAPSGKAQVVAMIKFAAIPPLRDQEQALNELPLPREEAKQAKAYLKAFSTGVDTAESDPVSVTGGLESGPFVEAEELAKKFGFKVCRGA